MESEAKFVVKNQEKNIRALAICRDTVKNTPNTVVNDITQNEIKSLFDDFKINQNELRAFTKEPEYKINYDIISKLQDDFYAIYEEILSLLSQQTIDSKPVVAQTVTATPVINAPRVTIKPFSGDPLDWSNFKTIFDHSVNDNENYSKAQKLQLLRTFVTGNALSLIQHIDIKDDNYVLAYKLLVDRYDNVRTLSNFHYSRLINFKHSENLQQTLSNFTATFNSSICALKTMKINLEDFLIFKLAFNSLPVNICADFEKQCAPNKLPTYDELMTFVINLEKSYESTIFDNSFNISLSPNDSQKNQNEKPKTNFNRKPATLIAEQRAFDVSKNKFNSNSHNLHCVICRSTAHNAYSCDEFLLLSIDNRYKKVRDLDLCTNCLGYHNIANCKSVRTCKICHLNHNTLLHRYDADKSRINLISENRDLSPRFQRRSPRPHDNTTLSCINNDVNNSCMSPQPSLNQTMTQPPPGFMYPWWFFNPPQGNSTPCASNGSFTSNSPILTAPSVSSSVSQPITAPVANNNVNNNATITEPNASNNTVTNLSCNIGNKSAILGTAVIDVLNHENKRVKIRAVLDSGSEISVITRKAANKLGLQIQQSQSQILGISSSNTRVQGQVNVQIRSPIDAKFELNCNALVLSHIIGPTPSACLPPEIIEQFEQLPLADPNFIHSGPIEMLLGIDTYSELIDSSAPHIIKGKPSAFKTVFGYVIFGKIETSLIKAQPTHSLLTTLDSVDNSLRKFWEIEEVKLPVVSHPDDEICEQLYRNTTTRDESGRYIVALPFKPNIAPLTNNRSSALKNYFRFENRLNKNPELQEKYHNFMREYIDLGHMSMAISHSSYIIPHHCVLKESSSTTKLRTVFNASSLDSNGQSLNGQLLPGPKLQHDIGTILISFRMHEFVVTADVKMMYRQIRVRPEDLIHQHIYYRVESSQPPAEFQLNTVTYGLTPSAYLAQRTLLKLVEDEGNKFPRAALAIANHTYVDDILTGASSVDDAKQLIQDLINLLQLGGFSLRKWTSNSPSLLSDFPQDHLENPLLFSDDSPSIKILGLQWTPRSDDFSYQVTPFDLKPTKRNILSYIAKMFDPLGFLAPVTFWAKFFMQKLWQEKLNWDDELPSQLSNAWMEFSSHLSEISTIKIPRFFGTTNQDPYLIGFCDASERGYAAGLYLRMANLQATRTFLLKAKTRVAPVKTVTIPRLELCAALLLAHLFESVSDSLSSFQDLQVRFYSDSQIVLTWLHTPVHKLKIFVANRVRQILAITSADSWHHIPSEQNPADVASRGVTPQELVQHSIWWNGPEFLSQHPSKWPISTSILSSNIPELRTEKPILLIKQNSNYFIDLFARYSSFSKLLRIMAYVLRFIKRARDRTSQYVDHLIQVEEIENATHACVRIVQIHAFPKEYTELSQGKPTSTVNLKSLTPFYHYSTRTLRAAGRLANSALPFDSKHPMILPRNEHFTKILCRHYHESSLHAGPRTTQSIITQKFWIVGLRSTLRWIIHNCVKCVRYQSKPIAPLMADLPSQRVNVLHPFQSVGIDFAGPFSLKTTVIRNAKVVKAYMCIFICTSTKAVHLECVSDLTTDSFLAAFDRFVSRRGLPAHIYSDNGTNFVGAAASLAEIQDFLQRSHPEIHNYCTERFIEWHFNPPSAPNFGGLWEAAVKSTKFHLHRVLNKRVLTFEEFSTLLTRIEAVLNSRPLFEPSPDPNESLITLTPGHFLVGRPLVQAPDRTYAPQLGLKSRWILIRQLLQNFWHIWSKHYLHTIIQRNKWHHSREPFAVGQIVLAYGVDTSPSEWPLGIITQVHPGHDGIVRVVTLRTAYGTYKRPVNKLIHVPI